MGNSILTIPDVSAEELLGQVERQYTVGKIVIANYSPVQIRAAVIRDRDLRGDLRGKRIVCFENYFFGEDRGWFEGVRQFFDQGGYQGIIQAFLAHLLAVPRLNDCMCLPLPTAEGSGQEVVCTLFHPGAEEEPDARSFLCQPLDEALKRFSHHGCNVVGFKLIQ